MLEFKYGLLIDGNEHNKVIIETNCSTRVFQIAVDFVKDYSLDPNADKVIEAIRSLGFKAEHLDDSTDYNFNF